MRNKFDREFEARQTSCYGCTREYAIWAWDDHGGYVGTAKANRAEEYVEETWFVYDMTDVDWREWRGAHRALKFRMIRNGRILQERI